MHGTMESLPCLFPRLCYHEIAKNEITQKRPAIMPAKNGIKKNTDTSTGKTDINTGNSDTSNGNAAINTDIE